MTNRVYLVRESIRYVDSMHVNQGEVGVFGHGPQVMWTKMPLAVRACVYCLLITGVFWVRVQIWEPLYSSGAFWVRVQIWEALYSPRAFWGWKDISLNEPRYNKMMCSV